MNGEDEAAQKIRLTAHERVPKMVAVCTIMYLFCEDMDGIDCPRDVTIMRRLILDPFANRVFVKHDVPGSL